MIECRCSIPADEKVTRLNPTTLRTLYLCDAHAALHDIGASFTVRESHEELNR